ncbi:MAG: alpha/beta hydrolase [Candidatus Lokiarchaeota archaeon]|nr:alpha/beta hydrolase [Candidatus Lokiarchaeota archaeon]
MSEEIIKKKFPQFKSEFAEVNNVKLHYIKVGPEDGKLIVFLHGFPQFWYMWRDQLLDLSKDYLAVAPDMRGYNTSSKPEEIEQYQPHHIVEDIRALVEEHFGRKKFILVGHDWGGVIAFPLANMHPDLVEKLIIINAPHPNIFGRLLSNNKDQQTSSQYVLFFRTQNAEAFLSANDYQNLFGVVITSEMDVDDDDRQLYRNAWSQPGALTGGLNYYRAGGLRPPSQGEDISELSSEQIEANPIMINVPTLVIWGEKDTALTVHNLKGLDEFIPDLTIKRIPEGSHWVVNEVPDKVNALIREFI